MAQIQFFYIYLENSEIKEILRILLGASVRKHTFLTYANYEKDNLITIFKVITDQFKSIILLNRFIHLIGKRYKACE